MVAFVTKKQLVVSRPADYHVPFRRTTLSADSSDNVRRQATEPTDASTFNQAASDNDRHAHLERLAADNARLHAEIDSLRAQLQGTTTSDVQEVSTNASLCVHTPTE
ncbi:hypothetical protein MTO96_033718 [Rhipicephalus appendiculatus]